jgi:hypothetical protein
VKDDHLDPPPGDDSEPGVEQLELPASAPQPLGMPRRADLTGSDQARRSRPVQPASGPASPPGTGSAAAQTDPTLKPAQRPQPFTPQATPLARPQPAAETKASTGDQPGGGRPPAGLASAHPLARLRLGEPGGGRPRIGLPAFRGFGRRSAVASRSTPGGSSLRRRGRSLPSLRTVFALTGVAATVAVVASLLMALPSQPAAPAATGSVYQISWRSAARPPATKFDFGPYFTSFDNDLVMLGTAGSTTTVWTSADGSSWSQISGSGAFDISGRRFVAQGLSYDGSGGLIAVGNSVGSSSTDVAASAWYSRDGQTWVPTQVDSATGQEMIGGAVTRPGAVVTAGNGVAWYSPNGQRWTPYVLPGATNFIPRAVGAWGGGFAIVGLWSGVGPPRSAVWYSATGRDWSQASTSLDGFDARGIAGSDHRIVAVGSDTGAAAEGLAASWSSADGKTWVKASAPSNQPRTAMDGVTLIDESFVAAGAADQNLAGGATAGAAAALSVWVSDDGGVSWLPIPSSAQPLSHGRLATVAGHLVLVGGSSGGQGLLAGDITLGPTRTPTPAPSAAAQFALSLTAGDSPMIPDVGATDTLATVAATSDRFLTFVTQPAGTSIWSSGNGSLWAQETTPDALVKSGNTGRPVVLQAINDGKGGVIAVGRVTNPSGDTGTIWRLPSGGTWHQVTLGDPPPPEFSSVAAGPGGFVAASDKPGGSQLMHSIDGETWNAATISIANGYFLTVGTYKLGFVATGSDPTRQGISTAWTSPDGSVWTMRPDWKLPVNVTQVFGIGDGLVATTSGTGVAPSASASASARAAPSSVASALPTPTPKPTPAPTAAGNTPNTWWWSSTGIKWQQSGLQTSGDNWAVVNGRILAFDVPTKAAANWTVWSSVDGKNWLHPESGPVVFGGSTGAGIASIGSQVVIVGWQAKAQLKDYFGTFASP